MHKKKYKLFSLAEQEHIHGWLYKKKKTEHIHGLFVIITLGLFLGPRACDIDYFGPLRIKNNTYELIA